MLYPNSLIQLTQYYNDQYSLDINVKLDNNNRIIQSHITYDKCDANAVMLAK